MKRNICTLTDSSCIAQDMIRSSHQRRSHIDGCDTPVRSSSARPVASVSCSIAASWSAGKSSVTISVMGKTGWFSRATSDWPGKQFYASVRVLAKARNRRMCGNEWEAAI